MPHKRAMSALGSRALGSRALGSRALGSTINLSLVGIIPLKCRHGSTY